MKLLTSIFTCLLLGASSVGADVTAKFNFENAVGAELRTEENQQMSLNGTPIQQNRIKTTFEITDVKKEGDTYHVQVTYRSQEAKIVINGQKLDTKTNPQLKAASDDLVGRKLTYVVGANYRVQDVQGVEELQNSNAGRTFGAALDESIFKRTFERILLTRSNLGGPLNQGEGWQIAEETPLDANTKFTLKSDVVLADVDAHQLTFQVSSKGEIDAALQDVSIETPKGTGKIVWNRDLNLPTSISLDTAVKITNKTNSQSPVTIGIELSTKTSLEPATSDESAAKSAK